MAVVAAVVALVLVGAAVTVLATRGEDRTDSSPSQAAGGPQGPAGGGSAAPGPSSGPGAGKELTLLAGRLVVAARPGWEALESSEDTVAIKLALREQGGRQVLGTLIVVTLPSPGSLDTTLQVDGGTSFDIQAAGGPMRVTAVPGAAARVVAGAVRPKATFFLSLSLFALDGRDIDVATLRKLFTEQVVPALRFP